MTNHAVIEMNILAVLPHYGATASRFLVDAFERMGHRVFRVGPLYDFHLDMQWDTDEMPKVDLVLPKNANWHIDDYVDAATRAGYAPDFVFISEESYNNVIVNTEKVPSALWSVDGWPENYARRGMINATISYTSHPRGIRIRQQPELPQGWYWLPGGAFPSVHRYLGLERDIDFTLFATFYTERPRIVKEIKNSGLTIKVGQAKTPEYVIAYNRALCTLHQPGYFEIKWRFWESCLMGCINISSHTPPLDWLGYKPWIHYISVPAIETDDGPWPDSSEAIKIMLEIKKYPTFFRQIANEARKYTVANHTYYNRAKQIGSDLGIIDLIRSSEIAIENALADNEGIR